MKWPLITRKKHKRLLTAAVNVEFERVSAVRAEPLTRGWAVDLNCNIFHAKDSDLRRMISNALQEAAGQAMRPRIGVPESSFRILGATHE